MYKLVIQDDEGKTTVVPLIRDELTIGRKEGNTIRLTERNVSRQHARLTRANGTIVIEDLNSYNGIRVNGSRIQGRATIKESDRVQIGDYLIEVRSDAVAEQGASQDETQPLERVEGTSPPATMPMPVATAEGTSPGTIAAVAPEPVALADTDPGRAAASVSNHGRLVILSTNFAGQEFPLDKPKLVIGRTDDNDIWLNHRSISRHHARVLFENGRYSIEDMQSSNGVRVNGEEYGKVELRRADVIDLGHVRLRFIEPGEDFVFGRDAQAVDVTPYSGGRAWLWVALAGIALAGMIVVFFVMNGGGGDSGTGEDSGSAMAGTGDDPGTGGVVQPDPPDAAAVEVDPVVADAAVDLAAENKAKALENLAQARRLLASNQLSEARVAIQTAESLDPKNPEILAVSKEIESRLDAADAAEANWARFMNAVNNAHKLSEARKVRNMAASFAGTKYAGQVKDQVARARSAHLRAMRRLAARADDCDARDRIASKVVWSDLENDVKRVRCKEPPDPGSGSGSGTGTPEPVDRQKEYQQHILDGEGGNNVARAYSACGKVRGQKWIKKCVVMACRNKNQAKAQAFLGRVSRSDRGTFKNLCMGQGVPLK